jgi:hypothetical protein
MLQNKAFSQKTVKFWDKYPLWALMERIVNLAGTDAGNSENLTKSADKWFDIRRRRSTRPAGQLYF